jgi:hypothetical protein
MTKSATVLSPTEVLADHISQNGITYGPEKLEIFRQACRLRGVPALDDVEASNASIAQVKIFDPCGSWTWYIIAWDPKSDVCFGFVDGAFPEYGDFWLGELAEIKGPLKIGLEVDTFWTPRPCKEIADKAYAKANYE